MDRFVVTCGRYSGLLFNTHTGAQGTPRGEVRSIQGTETRVNRTRGEIRSLWPEKKGGRAHDVF